MSALLDFLVRHGYVLLFVWVLAEQFGLPIPSAPLLLAAGALAGTHRMNLEMVFVLPIVAVAIGDATWYELGRLQGARILKWLCRISLEPDSCVRRTQVRFERNGAWALVGAKFIPGLGIVATPLAGISRMPWRRFALYDGAGTLLWAGAYIGAGVAFSGELERVAAHLAFLGRGLFVLLVAGLVLYIAAKYFNRRRFLRKLRIARISPEDLRREMDAGEDVIIVDLRHASEFQADPETIPGAVRMEPADLEDAVDVIPRDRDIVVFCSCPNEATAAQMALRLRSLGITRIRPLAGGLAGWRDLGFPVQLAPPLGDDDSAALAPAPGQ